MLKHFVLSIFLIFSTASYSYGFEVVAVKSSTAEPYSLAFESFSRTFTSAVPTRGPKSITQNAIITRTINQDDTPDRLVRQIRKENPDLLIAFGSKALRFTASIKDIPIIYLLVPSPDKIIRDRSNVTGVLLQPVAGLEFRALRKIAPALKRIGVVYNPAKSKDLVRETISNNKDLHYMLRPVQQPQEVAKQLDTLASEVDLVWMPPDSTVLTPHTEQSFYLFSLQNEVPLLAFSEKYLKKGASFAVSLDLSSMGDMAADLALLIKNGAKAVNIPPIRPQQVKLKQNSIILNKLGFHIQEVGQ
ncbi:MAG: ABC transporter substrate binding protein [Thermodesulfobacteriota bacterium]